VFLIDVENKIGKIGHKEKGQDGKAKQTNLDRGFK
jgi:hypothetical protein